MPNQNSDTLEERLREIAKRAEEEKAKDSESLQELSPELQQTLREASRIQTIEPFYKRPLLKYVVGSIAILAALGVVLHGLSGKLKNFSSQKRTHISTPASKSNRVPHPKSVSDPQLEIYNRRFQEITTNYKTLDAEILHTKLVALENDLRKEPSLNDLRRRVEQYRERGLTTKQVEILELILSNTFTPKEYEYKTTTTEQNINLEKKKIDESAASTVKVEVRYDYSTFLTLSHP